LSYAGPDVYNSSIADIKLGYTIIVPASERALLARSGPARQGKGNLLPKSVRFQVTWMKEQII